MTGRGDARRTGGGGRWRRLVDEQDGLSAGAEALVFGVLVFVVGTLIVVNAWAVVDADLAASAAAREATRAMTETTAGTWGEAYAAAAAAARATIAGYGKDPGAVRLEVIEGPDPDVESAAPPQRCRRITIVAHYPVRPVRLPIIGGWAAVREVAGRHTELVDPLRSGLAGEASCA